MVGPPGAVFLPEPEGAALWEKSWVLGVRL